MRRSHVGVGPLPQLRVSIGNHTAVHVYSRAGGAVGPVQFKGAGLQGEWVGNPSRWLENPSQRLPLRS